MSDLIAEKRKLEERLAQVNAAIDQERQRRSKLTIDQQVAEELHRILCHQNHTDGCGWEYESWENPMHTHPRYLKVASDMLDSLGVHFVSDRNNVLRILQAIPRYI